MTTIRPTELKVRCYAEREAPRLWVAICLDFDLAAQGETLEKARRVLDAMINDYVEDTWDGEDQPYADALMSRRAPLRYWLRFYWFTWMRRLNRKHTHSAHYPFNERLPLSLAHCAGTIRR
ncbi:hypothetical protein [Thiocystis violascens]|uniref:DUF1902 domain-containing protein n=1 Tax=Thiocystis violascens (strain ATCC 17096 / DSM 198 / 6111) TaxID=765911 RepID=I3YBP1_THIV6|nr:hypothetical protein [Thiocystis violascens]AFL74409.1 hypothetical protein Thivi_2469 [Thiocystis violascens DSM 198]